MSEISTFETLPDEIILDICQYLRCAEILCHFYSLNSRLNNTITDFLRHVDPSSIQYRQFQFVVLEILPQIGASIRSFVYRGVYQSIVSNAIRSFLFCQNLSVILPNLHTLTLTRFTGEQLFAFIESVQDLLKLVKLDICSLEGKVPEKLLKKILAANNCRLQSVTFDQCSDSLSLTEDPNGKFPSYINIEKLIVNLKNSVALECLMGLIPNVNYLKVSYDRRTNVSVGRLKDTQPLLKLKDFYLSGIYADWTFDEVSAILNKMPSLNNLSLDIRTADERLIDGQISSMVLPTSLINLNMFIIYFRWESDSELETLNRAWPTHVKIGCLLSSYYPAAIIHTIPCNLFSIVIPAKIAKDMLPGWEYMKNVKHLRIYGTASDFDVSMIIQHFRNLRTLHIDVTWESTSTEEGATRSTPPVSLDLPKLERIKVTEQHDLFHWFCSARNLNDLSIDFGSLDHIMKDDSTSQFFQKQLTRIHVRDIVNIDSIRYNDIAEKFNNLLYLVLSMKNVEERIDSLILQVLAAWRNKRVFSLLIRGSVSDGLLDNLRQWLVDHTHLRDEDPFVAEYKKRWLWIWF